MGNSTTVPNRLLPKPIFEIHTEHAQLRRTLANRPPSSIRKQMTMAEDTQGRSRRKWRLGGRGRGGRWLFLSLGLGRGRRVLGGLGLLLGCVGSGTLALVAVRRRPESQVVTEQLHDERAVAVRLLRERVELGNGVIEGLLGEVASTVGRVQDLVVKDREVEGEAEADGVRRCELRLGDIRGRLGEGGTQVSSCSTCR